MKILSVASEIHPLIKTGGLADVAGALPLALADQGMEVVSLLPGYRQVMAAIGKAKAKTVLERRLPGGGEARVLALKHKGLDLFVLDAPALFDREGGPYADASGSDHPDNWRRFALFSSIAADIASGALPAFVPDLVHVHDWQAAMTLAYLRYGDRDAPACIITIHNLAFQGRFPESVFSELGLPPEAYSVEGVEYYGGVGFLKAGLQAADAITTVSPTYAKEIRTSASGMGLDGLLNARGSVLHGIVNGIDVEEWNPEDDRHLSANFDSGRLKARLQNREAVERRFGLETGSGPLLAVISRLTWQKGMDVLAECVDGIIASGARIAVLGSGDKAIEAAMLAAAARHRGLASVEIGYDEGLSHLMQAGADAILVPSRFEPCGLTQLCGLRYGCIPVVTHTGGLADTVIDANHAAIEAGAATGIFFERPEHGALIEAVRRTVTLHANRKTWQRMQKAAMKSDVSWKASAGRYAELFRELVRQKRK